MSKRLALLPAAILGGAFFFWHSPLLRAQTICDPAISADCPSAGVTGVYAPVQSGAQPLPAPDQEIGGNIYGAQPGVGANGSLTPAPVPNYIDNLQGTGQPTRTGGTSSRYPYTYVPYVPPTEFQRLVSASVGRLLPIYGANLFLQSPSTFAPNDQIPVTPDYLVGPGDQLLIRVWGQINFNAEVTVDRSGAVYLPQVGAIHVAGIRYGDLQQQLRSNIGRIYKNFDLSANLGQLRSIRIFVTGQARRPGTYTVSALSTLVSATFATGGPSPEGSMRHIQVRRGGRTVTDFDLYDLLVHGDKAKDVSLISGDVLYIPPVGPQVAVFGSVRNQAIFELGQDNTVSQAVMDAGGLSALASLSRASLERIDAQQHSVALDISLDSAGMKTPLQGGDILRVLPISPRFAKTVTLRGNLADPGRFSWHAGMRLSELLPDSGALITRDYWQRRNQLGLPSPSFSPDYTQRFQAYANQRRNQQRNRAANPTGTAGQPAASSPQPDLGLYGDQPQQDLYGGRVPDNYPGQGNQTDSNGQPIDPAQGVNPNGTPVIPPAEIGGSTLAEQQRRTFTQNTASASVITDVKLTAPEIDWSYAVIERLDPVTLRTSLVSFDLGKLVLNHDTSQDLPLEPGDVVTIFSQADLHVPQSQQTKFVRLEGEVKHAGYYSVLPGEDLKHLVERAGGITENAYLFGSELTRESTRVVQQQRVDDYVSNLELEADRASATTAGRALSPQDQAVASSSLAATQTLVARLRQIRATGRIVLNVSPGATDISSLPSLGLEDGDRFVVPARPSSINVVGAVYDQSSFLYNPERRVGGYLHEAGGANRDADQKHAFMIRADGSVISRESANTIWGNAFDQARVNPGDTIVVPEKVYRGSGFRDFLNYTQVFSQLALGAASLSVIGIY